MKKHLFLLLSSFFMGLLGCERIAEEELLQELLNKKNHHQNGSFKAHLSGDQEVPAVETKATGKAIFVLSKDGTQLHYKLIVANIENVRMAHIHLAPAGENGAVAVWLYPSAPPAELIPGRTNGVLAKGIITEDDLVGELAGSELADLVELMAAGEAYVNIHTSQFGGGEIRGQIKETDPYK